MKTLVYFLCPLIGIHYSMTVVRSTMPIASEYAVNVHNLSPNSSELWILKGIVFYNEDKNKKFNEFTNMVRSNALFGFYMTNISIFV
jgi:hypothetical protein